MNAYSHWLVEAAILACVLLLACCGANQRVAERPAPPENAADRQYEPGEPVKVTALVADALPNVVLVLNYKQDGKIGYGAGIVVSRDGMALTCLHVIADAKNLAAMRYRPDRQSYLPTDGGLSRYMHDHANEMFGASLILGDTKNDLAVLQLDTDTSGCPMPRFFDEPVRQGEPIYAVGHPKEAVWSFTQGVISAVYKDAIQHDAAVNTGNSGGPLLDSHGRVIGINTLKLMGDAEGMAYARPAKMVESFIEQLGILKEEKEIDLSTPKRSVESCLHALQFSLPILRECFNLEHEWYTTFRVTNEIIKETTVSDVMPKRFWKGRSTAEQLNEVWHFIHRRVTNRILVSLANALRALNKWDDFLGTMYLSGHGPGFCSVELTTRLSAVFSALESVNAPEVIDLMAKEMKISEEKKKVLTTLTRRKLQGFINIREDVGQQNEVDEARSAVWDERLLRDNNLKRLAGGSGDCSDVVRLGLRVEDVSLLSDGTAWVSVVGKNYDGSDFRFSKFLTRKDGKWIEEITVPEEALKSLPKGWPPPLRDEVFLREETRKRYQETVSNKNW